jgi:hypothetical protein
MSKNRVAVLKVVAKQLSVTAAAAEYGMSRPASAAPAQTLSGGWSQRPRAALPPAASDASANAARRAREDRRAALAPPPTPLASPAARTASRMCWPTSACGRRTARRPSPDPGQDRALSADRSLRTAGGASAPADRPLPRHSPSRDFAQAAGHLAHLCFRRFTVRPPGRSAKCDPFPLLR